MKQSVCFGNKPGYHESSSGWEWSLVEEPSVPSFLKNDPDILYNDCEHRMGDALTTSHAVATTALLDDEDKQTKKHILRFPGGMKGKMGYMNDSDSLVITGHSHMWKTMTEKKNKEKIILRISRFDTLWL